jgi:hypothetical protein
VKDWSNARLGNTEAWADIRGPCRYNRSLACVGWMEVQEHISLRLDPRRGKRSEALVEEAVDQ